MTKLEFVESIRNLIAELKIKEAIELMKSYCVGHEDELTIHLMRFNDLKSKIRMNVIDVADSDKERNRICFALLELAKEVELTERPARTLPFSKELQDIIALAEMQSRRDGEQVTGTREFFRALVTLRPASLLPIIAEIEKHEALPKPIDAPLLDLPRLLSPNRPLSACMTNSTNALMEVVSTSSPILTEEMFVDVAKFGKGKSVKKLREHNITPDTIEGYVADFNVQVRRRVE